LTLQFEATVGAPRQGVVGALPPSWNISLQQGDTISGVFTIEPFDAPANTYNIKLVQALDFSIQIKSRSLTTTQYGVEVFNNVVADDVPEPYDSIHLGCSFFDGGTICSPTNVSPLDPTEWAFGIALFADEVELDGADVPFDPRVWERFITGNTMLISFNDPDLGWAYGFLATIESLRVVPEPDMGMMFSLGSVFMILIRNAHR
jgi:hypothetical protein